MLFSDRKDRKKVIDNSIVVTTFILTRKKVTDKVDNLSLLLILY